LDQPSLSKTYRAPTTTTTTTITTISTELGLYYIVVVHANTELDIITNRQINKRKENKWVIINYYSSNQYD